MHLTIIIDNDNDVSLSLFFVNVVASTHSHILLSLFLARARMRILLPPTYDYYSFDVEFLNSFYKNIQTMNLNMNIYISPLSLSRLIFGFS